MTINDIITVIQNCPQQYLSYLVVFMILLLVIWLTIRIDKLVTKAISKEELQNNRIDELFSENAILKKRVEKLMQTVSLLPAVDKKNATWLLDDKRNGGQPPEAIVCKWQEKENAAT